MSKLIDARSLFAATLHLHNQWRQGLRIFPFMTLPKGDQGTGKPKR